MGLKLTAKAGGSKMPAGLHVMTITNVEEVSTTMVNEDGSSKHDWSDALNQIKISLEMGGNKIDAYQSLEGRKYRGDDFSDEVANISTARLKALGLPADKKKWNAMSYDEQLNKLFKFVPSDEYGDQSKEYAVYAVGEKVRVADPDRTDKALAMAGRLGFFAGIAGDGDEFDTDNLINQEIGVEIVDFNHRSGKTYSKIAKFMKPSQVDAEA